ncbi:MAG: hypothetical protein KF777_10850 [Planctomycetaceae bacterium]|nr:hypothetical protein [Planctomycetaceae bacterium]
MSDTDLPMDRGEELRRQMAAIRRKLPGDVERIVDGARQMVDWRNYVRDFPWGTALAAVAVGYWLVPRRKGLSSGELKKIEESFKRQTVRKQNSEPATSAGAAGLGAIIGGLVVNLATRAAINFAAQQVGKMLGAHASAAPRPESPTREPSWTPNGNVRAEAARQGGADKSQPMSHRFPNGRHNG